MNTIRLFLTATLVALLGNPIQGHAEDIDIYSGLGSTVNTPNVLFVMDNSANFEASSGGVTCMQQTDGSLVINAAGGTATAMSGKVGGIEQCALWNVVKNLPVNADTTARVNIGFMVYNGPNVHDVNNANCGGSLGGCLTQPMIAMTATNKTGVLNWIASWNTLPSAATGNVKAAGKATAATMQEAWAYYKGTTGLSTRSYSGIQPTGGCQKNFVIYIGNAFSSASSPGDASSGGPLNALTTAINNQPQPPSLNAAQWTAKKTTWSTPILNTVNTACGTAPGSYNFAIPSSNHTENGGDYADEWARFMQQSDIYDIYSSSITVNAGAFIPGVSYTILTAGTTDFTSIGASSNAVGVVFTAKGAGSGTGTAKTEIPPGIQSITTYTVGLLDPASCKPEYAALLNNMATYGGGKYFATTSYDTIVNAILKILNEVQAVNSVFSSSSLPVSVNAQGTYLNQIYMGMFRPDPNALPRWAGNLKQYQFIIDPITGGLNLGDSVGDLALDSSGTGFLSPNAISFWTCTNPALNSYPSVYLTAAQQALLTANKQTNINLSCAEPTSGFWVNDPSSANAVAQGFDLPDGERVERGGTAQQIRQINLTDNYATAAGSSTNPRNLYTWLGTSNALTNTANVFDTSNTTGITDILLGTGPRTIASITSATTVQASGTLPGTSGTAITVSITAFAKSGSTVTATVSLADMANISVGTSLKIATGSTKYDCNPCTVLTIPTTTSFTYAGASGTQAAPATPYTATVYTNFVTVTNNNHGLAVGQILTLSACTTYTTLNGTIDPITAVTTNTFTLATTVSVVGATSDSGCKYTPNTATVTATAHGFSNGATVTIAGATPTGYNGSWVITATGAATFTYQYTVAAPLANFSGAGATATSISTTRDTLIRWVRGEDNFGDEASLCPPGTPAGTSNCPNPAVTIRPSVHGDVLHSRPTVINYGGSTGVVVFYGDNGGVFHAVNGNQTAAIGSVGPGDEMWGFIPKEFFLKLNRLHDNSPMLCLPSTPGYAQSTLCNSSAITPTPMKKDYFIDGTTGLYQLIDGNGITLKAYLYVTMRRGGRFIYALDVTNPASPQLLWKVDNTSANMSELGQTWSQPKVAKVAGYANPVLIFGAGYDDTNEDNEPPTANTSGRGIFVLDAITGALVWKATPSAGATSCTAGPPANCVVSGMNYGIPADITLMDRDGDGFIDRLYAADVGGNIWRVDLEPSGNSAPANWQVYQLAALGCWSGACAIPTATTQRKFFYAPEVITATAAHNYDAVIAGSGDREHPLYVNTATQRYNRVVLLTDTYTSNNAAGMTPITFTGGNNKNLFDATSTPWDGTLYGYYITLAAGEKVVNAPLVTAGFVFFGTNQPTAPSANSCTSTLGIAKGYRLEPFTGTLGSVVFSGGGLPPSPVSGVVNITTATGTKLVPFLIGGGNPDCVGSDCSSALGGQKPAINVPTSRTRTYWYKE